MIHILNRFDEIIGFLSNENPETPVYWGGKHTEKLNSAANYYEFSTVTDHEYVQELTNMNKVVASHPDGYFIPFRIHRVTQRNKDGVREKVVEVEGEHMRLRTAKVLSPITLTSATLKTAARFILSGTGWQVGLVEFAGAKTIEFNDFTNALKALHHINELFGMEIRFRIVIQRNKVVGRYVDFLERIGEDNGKEIVLAKDLMSVERIEDSNNVYTALIGIGKANEEGKFITFEGINGGKNYVEDQDAFQRWGDESGHHIGVYYVQPEEGEELTPEIVRERTKEALKRHIDSVVQYKVTGASLEKVFDLDHEKVRKGDTVRIKDTGFTPPLYLKARVLETFRYDDPGKEDEFLLGNYHELKIKPNQLLLDLQKRLFRNERKWSSAVRKVRSALPPQDQTVIWIDTTEVPNIVKTYNEAEAAWEKASPTVAAEVGAETPEGAEAKANTAKSEAIAYMNTQLTNYVNATLYSEEISDLQAQIDNQIQSHFKPYEPSLSNEPASDWRTDEEKRNHVGDLFYNTETGHSYRFALDGTIYTWLMVRDEGIAKALADAAQAQDTADSKRRTFVSQPNTPYDEGDLWDKDGAVFRSTVTKTKSASFSLSDWVKIGDVTSENKAKDTDSVGGVPAEDIETKDGASGKANQAKADAQTFTETYANKKVTQSTSPPESPSHDDLWIDISVDPYVWKRWDGETWKKATPTTADEVGAETPNGAQYKANQAKEDAIAVAESKAEDARKDAVTSAQQDAAEKAANAVSEAQAFTEEFANKKVSQGTSAPPGATANDLWIDTSQTPYVWKRYTGSSWVKATPTTANEVGAETPTGAQSKANQAKADALSEANSFTEEFANKKVSQGGTSPSTPSMNDLWIDTSQTPYVWKRYTGSSWIKATPTTASEVGAETPSGAQAKANAAKATAESAAKSYTEGYAEKKVTKSTTAPSSPSNGDMWIDSSENVWKRWNGSLWVKLTRTSLPELSGRISAGQLSANIITSDHIGTAGLDAGVIKTGVLDAGRVRIGPGSVFESGFDPSTKETPSGAQSKANSAKSAAISTAASDATSKANQAKTDAISSAASDATSKANSAESAAKTYASNRFDGTKNLVSGWKYGSTTYIDGGNIYANTLTANAIASKTITANELKAGIIDSDLIVTAGLDAGVIKFGVMSGLRIQVGTLNADRIGAGVIDARRIAIGSGTSFDSGFDPSTKETPSGAQEKANAAKSSAISAAASDATSKATAAESAAKKHADDTYSSTKSLVDGWKYGSTTYINGGDIYTNTITANQIASKTITANQLKAGIIDSDLIVTAGLDAGVIKFGTMDGERITAETITTEQLVVKDFTNLAENPDFEDDVTGTVPRGYTAGSVRDMSSWSSGNGSIKCLEIPARSGGNSDVYGVRLIPVQPGQKFFLSAEVRYLNTNGDGYASMGFRVYGKDKSHISWLRNVAWSSSKHANWVTKSAVFTVPANVYYMQIFLGFTNNHESTNAVFIDNLRINRMANSELIVDGSITTDKIVTNGLNANVIKFGSMDGERIATNSLHANRIQSQTIDSDLIVTAGLDAGVIKYGTMHGNRIISNSLHGDKITAGTLNADRLEANSIIADDIKFTGTLDGATGNFAGELTAYSLKVDTQQGGELLIGTGSFGSGGSVWHDGGDVRIGNDAISGSERAINIESYTGDVEVDVKGTLRAKNINYVETISADEVYGTEVRGTDFYSKKYAGDLVVADRVQSSVFELASGDKNIVISDDNPNFRGYSMGAVIQFNGDGRADGALIKAAGIQATSVLDLGTGRMYGNRGSLFKFDHDGSSYEHHTMQFGNALMKSLNSSQSTIQIRNISDTAYSKMTASDFQVGSLRSYKKNIEPYMGDALQKVVRTQVYHYHLNSDDDRELKRVGLIYEESDADVVDPAGDGMSSYSMTAVLWKALQDLNNKVVDLENKIA
ncbi:phage tail spike protein [Guptibacillus hwajinpoensis]|uniref:Tail spike domain-containing protein n=1 Tax=Guptibacillus hwajinpoensis TaxID=208199 RepID=A0A0J6CZU5_9BACL|nr:phage tail spike protein [Alkalihalobacillus macyae]KMM38593.1 hypothetical protein AB986_04760 [Alkalihalobacillus macyae]